MWLVEGSNVARTWVVFLQEIARSIVVLMKRISRAKRLARDKLADVSMISLTSGICCISFLGRPRNGLGEGTNTLNPIW